MPAILPAASNTVNGSIDPAFCKPSRRSISLAMFSGLGTAVYQSLNSSPSLTASTSPWRWSCDSGSSRACSPRRVTGSGQGIGVSPLRHCERSEAIHISACRGVDCFVASLLAMTSLFIQKVQRQSGPRPVHRDELALARQRDVGRLQLGAAEGDVG